MDNDSLTMEDHIAIEDAVDEASGGESAVYYIGNDTDYTSQLQTIHEDLVSLQEVGGYIEGFLIFASVVALCWFSYKFLRLFF